MTQMPPPTPLPSPPPDDSSRRPCIEMVIIPRSAEIDAVEEALSSLALVAMVGGIRPPVSPTDVSDQLSSFYNLPADVFSISRYALEDFLVRFNNRDDHEDILRVSVPIGTPFFLIWKRWRRQSMASAEGLRYKVLLGLKGMPAHIWGVRSAERMLGSSCAKLVEGPVTAAREDLREFVVVAWCVHPDFIPHEKLIAVPEPELPFFLESPLCLREHKVIHSELKVLRYLVRIWSPFASLKREKHGSFVEKVWLKGQGLRSRIGQRRGRPWMMMPLATGAMRGAVRVDGRVNTVSATMAVMSAGRTPCRTRRWGQAGGPPSTVRHV